MPAAVVIRECGSGEPVGQVAVAAFGSVPQQHSAGLFVAASVAELLEQLAAAVVELCSDPLMASPRANGLVEADLLVWAS